MGTDEKQEAAKKLAKDTKGFKVYVGGKFIREYTNKVHGKDAKKLAEMFAEKKGGKVK